MDAGEELADVLAARIGALESQQAGDVPTDDAKKWSKAVKKLTKQVDDLVADASTDAGTKVKELHAQLVEQITEAKKHERQALHVGRKFEAAEKERASNAAELVKVTAIKTRLESLCKQLQKQHREVSQTNATLQAEEKRKRAELQKHFNETIESVKEKMEEQAQARTDQIQENHDLREKLKHIVEQYDARDKLLADHHAQNDSRMQELDVQIKKQQGLYKEEIQKLLLENEEKKLENNMLHTRVSEYSEKFVELQATLQKSNGMFDTFKAEMDRMQQQMKKVEKQNLELKLQSEKSNKALVEKHTDLEALKKRTAQETKKKEALEKLCKQLQANARAAPAPDESSPAAEA